MTGDGRPPKCPLSTTHVLLFVELSTKYKIRMSNVCVQHDTVADSKHCHVVTCVHVIAITTILQLTLVTCGLLLRVKLGATKGTYIPIVTHNILIIIVHLRVCNPHMCGYMFPWTIWWAPCLSSNKKSLQMQECMHVLMQLSAGSPPHFPYNAPIPHACKQYVPYRNHECHCIPKSPLPSRATHSGERSIWLHHPYLLGFPIVGKDQYGYITLPSQGPQSGDNST